MCGAGKEMRVKDVGGGGVAKVGEKVDIVDVNNEGFTERLRAFVEERGASSG